ncbi:MAG TPA: tripartite tricarboxylate transporter substrate binding protein [Acidovorax sp.]|nr:tripartite tricarboxylate transporter substrate binding protein [Acidovorax sp.]
MGLALNARAADYPDKPVKMMVGFSPGGTVDAAGRMMAGALQKATNQNFIVENKPGVGGMLALMETARAAPDGYTLAVGSAGPLTVSPTLFKSAKFDPRKSLEPVIWFINSPGIIAVHKDLPARNMAELIELSKRKSLTVASAGTGSVLHLMGEYLQERLSIKWTHVPYKGSAPALLDLIAGRTDVITDLVSSTMAFVKSGQLRALAVTSKSRSPALPSVPTLDELGYTGLEMGSWMGLLAPKGTPAAVITRLNTILNAAIQSPELAEQVRVSGNELAGGSPRAMSDLIDAELPRWEKVIQRLGLKPE